MPRSQAEIDWDKVDELLIRGSPGTEVAAHFGIHPDTLYKKIESKYHMGFSAYLHEKRSYGNALLRAQQFDKAMGYTKKGDTQLLLKLGQERLGQKDSKENDEKSNTIQLKVNYDGNSFKILPETLSTQNSESSPIGD
jgi:hypothetical protein